MSDKRVLGVALTKCFFCNEDADIMINTRLTPGHAARVEEAHQKVIDMRPCQKCEKLMKQGVILITFDPSKSAPDWDKQRIPNPWRTGGWFVVTDDAMKRAISHEGMLAWALKHRWMFITHEAAVQFGLFEAAKGAQNAEEN